MDCVMLSRRLHSHYMRLWMDCVMLSVVKTTSGMIMEKKSFKIITLLILWVIWLLEVFGDCNNYLVYHSFLLSEKTLNYLDLSIMTRTLRSLVFRHRLAGCTESCIILLWTLLWPMVSLLDSPNPVCIVLGSNLRTLQLAWCAISFWVSSKIFCLITWLSASNLIDNGTIHTEQDQLASEVRAAIT